jgi:hypothetical protein
MIHSHALIIRVIFLLGIKLVSLAIANDGVSDHLRSILLHGQLHYGLDFLLNLLLLQLHVRDHLRLLRLLFVLLSQSSEFLTTFILRFLVRVVFFVFLQLEEIVIDLIDYAYDLRVEISLKALQSEELIVQLSYILLLLDNGLLLTPQVFI